MMDARELGQLAEYRSAMYLLAASAFTVEPADSDLRRMVEGAAEATGEDFVRSCEQRLLSHLAGYEGCDVAELGTRVRTEYAELFIGPRRPLAPCHESAYVGHPRRMFTQVTTAVRAFYARFGVEVRRKNAVPDDLLGYELEFLGGLCRREADAWGAGDADAAAKLQDAELEFLTGHVGAWIGLFTAKVEEAWCGDYYAAWARFVRDFVAEDIAFLRGSLGERLYK